MHNWRFLAEPDRFCFVRDVLLVAAFCVEDKTGEFPTVQKSIANLLLAAHEVMCEETHPTPPVMGNHPELEQD